MVVKFKRCPVCFDTKDDPLTINWIRPDEECCVPCELSLYRKFALSKGITWKDIYAKSL